MAAKATAAAAVAQLCRDPGCLEVLMEQPALLQVRGPVDGCGECKEKLALCAVQLPVGSPCVWVCEG